MPPPPTNKRKGGLDNISYCNLSNLGCTTGSTHVEQQLKEIEDPSIAAAEKAKQKQAPALMQAKPRLKADQSVFEVYKGVKCFHFSKEKNMIVTGGKVFLNN